MAPSARTPTSPAAGADGSTPTRTSSRRTASSSPSTSTSRPSTPSSGTARSSPGFPCSIRCSTAAPTAAAHCSTRQCPQPELALLHTAALLLRGRLQAKRCPELRMLRELGLELHDVTGAQRDRPAPRNAPGRVGEPDQPLAVSHVRAAGRETRTVSRRRADRDAPRPRTVHDPTALRRLFPRAEYRARPCNTSVPVSRRVSVVGGRWIGGTGASSGNAGGRVSTGCTGAGGCFGAGFAFGAGAAAVTGREPRVAGLGRCSVGDAPRG